MIKILFVCLGNICRSPLAEAIFDKKIHELGLEHELESDSCGTSGYHVGERPDNRTLAIAKKHHVPVDHFGKQFSASMGEEFHYFIAMDASNRQNIIKTMGGTSDKVYLMRHFDFLYPDHDVPDPYYGNKDGFEDVYLILNRSIDGFLKFLSETHQLTPQK
jgi:protein-tyrosine phosphatase